MTVHMISYFTAVFKICIIYLWNQAGLLEDMINAEKLLKVRRCQNDLRLDLFSLNLFEGMVFYTRVCGLCYVMSKTLEKHLSLVLNFAFRKVFLF